ncbi:MAG TPA: hypothetical protein VLJ84_03050 [Usitatibacter sp.]|nr:hypothetical protein [Usitatibacter sp.]HST00615.1 hypothetical protein [Usitatibacter sp.]
MQVAFLVTGIASVAGLVAMILTGLEKVHTGHGLDTFRTTWLVEFNWIGFLVLVAAIVIAVIGVGLLRYLEWREVRQLQDRYKGER